MVAAVWEAEAVWLTTQRVALLRQRIFSNTTVGLTPSRNSSSHNKWVMAWSVLWPSFRRKTLKRVRKRPHIWISTRTLAVTTLQWASPPHVPAQNLLLNNISKCCNSQIKAWTRATSFTTARWPTQQRCRTETCTSLSWTSLRRWLFNHLSQCSSPHHPSSWPLANRHSSSRLERNTSSQSKWASQWHMA